MFGPQVLVPFVPWSKLNFRNLGDVKIPPSFFNEILRRFFFDPPSIGLMTLSPNHIEIMGV